MAQKFQKTMVCDIWADAKPFLMVNSIGTLALEGLIVFHFVQRY